MATRKKHKYRYIAVFKRIGKPKGMLQGNAETFHVTSTVSLKRTVKFVTNNKWHNTLGAIGYWIKSGDISLVYSEKHDQKKNKDNIFNRMKMIKNRVKDNDFIFICENCIEYADCDFVTPLVCDNFIPKYTEA